MGVITCAATVDSKPNVSLDEKVESYRTWVQNVRSSGFTQKLMCSLDFTYTSHRTSRPKTLAGSGRRTSAQFMKTRYTNCIITGVFSDGRQLQSILYTYNSQFRTDRSKTVRRKQLEDKLSMAQRKYRVTDSRIVYDGKDIKESRTFVREYNDMVRDFLEFHKETLNSEEVIFFSDNGNAFRNDGGSIIEQMGYGNHVYYPPCVHQYLSPNDNKLHGAAKSKWRSMPIPFDDDVESSIALMKCLDDVPKEAITKWWANNLFLSNGIVREEQVKRVIFEAESKWSGLHEACINEYEEWLARDSRLLEERDGTPSRRNSGLDGQYWSNKRKRQ